jgi:N-methylhydantoinase A
VDRSALAEIEAAFHDLHLHTYGHDNRSEQVQLVSIRVAAIGAIPPLVIRDKPVAARGDGIKSRRQVWFRGAGPVEAVIHDRKNMSPGPPLSGPLVIESTDSTILVPPDWQAQMNEDGFVLLTRRQDGGAEQ